MRIKGLSWIHRLSGRRIYLWKMFVLLVVMGMSTAVVLAYEVSSSAKAQSTWHTFHDPIYGFSFQYPNTWTSIAEKDGSHITLLNPATKTTLSTIVTTQSATPAAILKQSVPASAIGVQTLTVAGQQAVDFTLPYVTGPKIYHLIDASAPVLQQTRQVVVPVVNASGTTNVYTIVLIQPTDANGKISPAEQAESTTFKTILSSFTLPAKVASVAHAASVNTNAANSSAPACDRVCWADANWNYNYYDDSSGAYSFYCDANAYNYGYSTGSGTCVDPNIYAAQAPSSGVYYQPNFQCADFASRALTQDGLVPGMSNGGVNGLPNPSSWSAYQSYKAQNGKTYNLIYTANQGGSDTTLGLREYLLDNKLGIDVGTNTSQIQPGDVIFMPGASGYRGHVVIATSNPFQVNGTWEIEADGHNRADYHIVIAPGGSGWDLVHLNVAPPAALKWYFPEGAVGSTYKEYITILNPSTTDANVTVQYFFQGGKAPLTISHLAPANLRSTVSVNNDLGIAPTAPLQMVSAIVTSVPGVSTPAVPIVVERPMYFNAHGVASGTDVQGATSTGNTFYFAAGDSSTTSQEFIEVLNPNGTTANVTVTYLSNGQAVETDHVSVPAQQRGTFSPTFHGQAAIQVVSDQQVVVERSEYFNGNVPNAGGQTTGASATMGVTTQGTDWLFAEGYTGSGFQENLVLANFATSGTATATIKLEYTNGTVQTVQQTINAQNQVIFDVNNANAHPNCGLNGNPACIVSNSVSIEVTSDAPIVAERVQYFHFGLNGSSHPGMDDVVGQVGPASQSVYSFAEGSAGANFLDWLTLQNPNSTSVVAAITIFADNTIVHKQITLPAHSRTSILINDIVNPLVAANPNSAGYTVSMDVQSFGGPIVAERPLYFTFNNGTGASDIIGYTGN